MITRIRAENFKSWKDTGDLRLAPLTGLFGTNNSGKTSILQMFLLMKQTVELPDRKRVLYTGDDRSPVDLGTFSDLIHRHQSDVSLRLSFSWKLPEPLVINDSEEQERELFNIRELSFTTMIWEKFGHLTVGTFVYKFDHHGFGMFKTDVDGPSEVYGLTHGGYPVKPAQGRSQLLPPPVKCYGFPDQAVAHYQNTGFLPDLVLALEEMFSMMTYLGPLREYPRRIYLWGVQRPHGVGIRGEQVVPALMAARVEGSEGIRNEARILEWLRKMRLIHSFSLQPIAPKRSELEIRVKTSQKSSEVLITDVGFGVSQILPVLALCYCAPKNSIIILEQPEIHLHPSVQADLADVLIDVVRERNVQIIVESHSEHLLRRIQRRIAEEVIPSDVTALYFCRMENGESKIEELNVDEFGNIRNWPQNFFGDEMGDLAAMTKAEMKRRKKAAHDGGG